MGDDNNNIVEANRMMHEFARPSLEGTHNSILQPPVAANNFEIKPNVIQMIGFSSATRRMVDAAVGGAFNSKTLQQAYNLIEEMVMNTNQWQSSWSRPGQQGVVNQDEPSRKEPEPVRTKDKKKSLVREYQPLIPYPARLKQEKVDQQFMKRRDPGSFIVPCIIGDLPISDALADLGASIMPSSLFEKLGLSEPKPTRMSIQLADRTVKYPRGIVENVLVKVDKFIFSIDFVVMDMEGESSMPLILGRPFLAGSRAVIDVCDGKLQIRVGDETITFDLSTSIRHSLDHDDTVYSVDVLDDIVESQLQEILLDDPLQVALQADEEELSIDHFDKSRVHKLRPSLEEPPALELKKLPKHLTYAYLDEAEKLSVIIAADLTYEEREMTLASLRKYLEASVYKIADIPGINRSYCSHKILMEDNYSSWLSPVQVVPKKGGMAVVKNEKDELISTRMRCMMAIFHDMIEESMEVFMDDFSEKCHFMVREGIVLGHKISHAGMEVDRAKAFELLKEKLTTIPILVSPNWRLPFELMCDASDFVVGAVLGQRLEKKFQPIYYARYTLTDAQEHYTTTEKELLALEFDIEIKDKKGAENLVTDHLLRLENPSLDALDERAIDDSSLDEYLCSIKVIGQCVYGEEILQILRHCHEGPMGGHQAVNHTARKFLDAGFY
ncbi:uncharacterized protein LOC125370425 [Ricinus communis]|uniref:uncharacterized protein LOC125370425 n=1 Tax=Ricinus communis TaxID=3988 RepID=UPI00201B207F|nr:uncharacterized protein LOC125370425 [Ricinus communis]